MGAHFGFTTVVFHSLTDRHAYTQTYIGIVCAPWSILCPLIDRVFLDGIYFFVVAQNPKCWLVFFFINPQLIKINVPWSLHTYQTAAIKNSHQKSNNLKVCIFFFIHDMHAFDCNSISLFGSLNARKLLCLRARYCAKSFQRGLMKR